MPSLAHKVRNDYDNDGRAVLSEKVLVNVHGGIDLVHKPVYFRIQDLYIENGISIISPNYHGSSGYGKTFEREKDVSVQVDDILAVLLWVRNKGVRRDDVLMRGMSTGAGLALQAAAKRPDLVGHLLLISPVATSTDVSATKDSTMSLTLVRGENDERPLAEMLLQIEKIFGGNAKRRAAVYEFDGEGHVIRRAESWALIHGVGLARLHVPRLKQTPAADRLPVPSSEAP
jgi:dipeptidyl aminopeptidase/acylaminoacyl peptidase